ncbi:MAG: hypothetical protein B7Z45_10500 [Azorhizobium sp. 12-66-6]|nr:MAG: hypothetical protein B7Z45_10500 [Azorhizobium sp. 12-66-6]
MRGVPASARIHAALREQIIAMDIAPGLALQEKQIALACGVSRTPVREALLKLADERLVDIFPQYGTFVSRCRMLTLPAQDRRVSVMAEHSAIIDAIAQGDVAGAEAAMQAHLGRVVPSVDELAAAHPDFFQEAPPPASAAPAAPTPAPQEGTEMPSRPARRKRAGGAVPHPSDTEPDAPARRAPRSSRRAPARPPFGE